MLKTYLYGSKPDTGRCDYTRAPNAQLQGVGTWSVVMAPSAWKCVFSTPFCFELHLNVFIKVVDMHISFHLLLVWFHLDIYNLRYDQNTSIVSCCDFMKFHHCTKPMKENKTTQNAWLMKKMREYKPYWVQEQFIKNKFKINTKLKEIK